ncbi:MAG TPA: hypothetical protein VFQ35_03135 [Polyangiaceae bacterium]|nr:hypothetical protein [Polyangiaceae bacterium]
MSDDLLRRAAQALREESEDGDAGERFTRARVMAGLQQNAGRRRLRLAFALPLAACFVAATAFGMKGQTTELWHKVTQALGFTHAEPAPRTKTTAAPQAAPKPIQKPPVVEPPAPVEPPTVETPAPAIEAPAAVEPPRAAPSAVHVPRVAPSAPPPAAEPAPAPVNPPPAPPEANDPAHELYRVAHQAHFVEHDFASALRAWDAYLAAAPSGRFAPEARYNRALCLVRLGRKDDAERALRPFAEGAYGTYRRDEAKALIEALQR